MKLCPTELRSHYLNGRLVPFIGAGVSMSVTWSESGTTKRGPSWTELVNQAALKLGFSDPELLRCRGTDLQILEYFGRKRHNEFAGLTNWLAAEMRPPDGALKNSLLHKRLAELENCHLFYTTNYDDFIERSFKLNGRECHTVVVEADMSTFGRAPHFCEVVKFHGDLEFPGQMVLSETHYERRLRLDTPMDLRFQADLLGHVFLFIGYSFRDWNVSYIFRLINERFNQLQGSVMGRRAFITVPNPSDFEIQLFNARNIEVIPVSERDPTADIAELLAELRS